MKLPKLINRWISPESAQPDYVTVEPTKEVIEEKAKPISLTQYDIRQIATNILLAQLEREGVPEVVAPITWLSQAYTDEKPLHEFIGLLMEALSDPEQDVDFTVLDVERMESNRIVAALRTSFMHREYVHGWSWMLERSRRELKGRYLDADRILKGLD